MSQIHLHNSSVCRQIHIVRYNQGIHYKEKQCTNLLNSYRFSSLNITDMEPFNFVSVFEIFITALWERRSYSDSKSSHITLA